MKPSWQTTGISPQWACQQDNLDLKKSLKCLLGLFYWMNVISWLSAQKCAMCWLTIKGLCIPKLLKQKPNVCDFSNGVHSKAGMSPSWPGRQDFAFQKFVLDQNERAEKDRWRKKAKEKQKDTCRGMTGMMTSWPWYILRLNIDRVPG